MTLGVNYVKFSLHFTREYKAISKENLAVYEKSLKAFFPGHSSFDSKVCTVY